MSRTHLRTHTHTYACTHTHEQVRAAEAAQSGHADRQGIDSLPTQEPIRLRGLSPLTRAQHKMRVQMHVLLGDSVGDQFNMGLIGL